MSLGFSRIDSKRVRLRGLRRPRVLAWQAISPDSYGKLLRRTRSAARAGRRRALGTRRDDALRRRLQTPRSRVCGEPGARRPFGALRVRGPATLARAAARLRGINA